MTTFTYRNGRRISDAQLAREEVSRDIQAGVKKSLGQSVAEAMRIAAILNRAGAR